MRYCQEEGCRRRTCAACGTITYTNPRVVAGCVPIAPDGRVMLLKRSIEPARGKWSYPAGYVEIGETVKTAAARETEEEIGVHVRIGNQIGIYSYVDAGVVTIVYEGFVRKGEKPRTTAEASDVQIVRPTEIPWEKLAFRSTIHALEDWAKGKKNAVRA